MLDLLSAIGVAAFGLVSLVVGVRLILLANRSHEIPELTIGVGFVVGVLFGFVPETLLYSSDLVGDAWVLPMVRLAEISIRLCAISVLVFTWRVFRPEASYAAVVVVGLTGTLLVSHVIFPYGRPHAESGSELVWATCSYAARTLAFLWGACEALRHYDASRRRQALGLADPILTNRFLLWGIAMAAASFLMGSMLLAPLFGLSAAEPGWLLAESASGSVAAAAIWLTFFPPRTYLDWLRRGAREAV